LAERIGADGVHFSEATFRHRVCGKRPGAKRRHYIITAAAHSYPALLRAARLGADAVLLSPVFATASHPGARPLGAVRFAACARKLRRASAVPIIALGGIRASNAQRVAGAGAAGFAAIGALS
jgi:thiamine-phosphate pyrophosphorylase